MAKNPTLRVSDLMETSRTIMEDRRLNLFLLELSFAGWWLPMILVCAAVLLLVGYNAYVVCVFLLPVFVRAYMVTFSPLLTTLFSWSPFRFTYLPPL